MRPLRLLALLLFAALLVPEPGTAGKPNKGPFKYLSPLPGADWVSARTTLIFRTRDHDRGGWMSDVNVVGSRSGRRSGRWIAASDGETWIFEPDGRFVAGERVEVTVGRGPGFSYGFTIAPEELREPDRPMCECVVGPDPFPGKNDWPDRPVRAPRRSTAGYELPESFPDISILVNERPSPGSFFLTNFRFSDLQGGGDIRYMIILDDDGEPAFFRPVPRPSAFDFKVQPDGRISLFHSGWYYLMDDTYTVVDSVQSQNYDSTDLHDLQVLPNGNFLLMGLQSIPYDMSDVVEGGRPDARIINMIIQELDGDDNVVFEWRSWDHYSPLDAIGYDLTGPRVDYVHTNSVELDVDGGIIMSHRHLDEVGKVSRETGEIVWHMGGKNNDFTLVNDDRWFSHQHSARRQPGGTMTLFDNGNNSEAQVSRAVEYEVDEVNMTVTRVWEYYNDPPQNGWAMGNVHRQRGGNTVIGWGSSRPTVTEVRPDGTKAFEMSYAPGMYSYRAFRFKWKGVAARPDLWATTSNGTLALNFVRFGDKHVAGYNVYGGEHPEPTQPVYTTAGNRMVVRGAELGEPLYFRVTALDRRGNESAFSNEIMVVPEFFDPALEATLRLTPKTLNLASMGNWIDARVDFGSEFGLSASDAVEDILLNGVVEPARASMETDGAVMRGLDLKFSREEVAALLEVGDAAPITVTGRVGDVDFTASGAMRVIGPSLDGEARGDAGVSTALRAILPNPFNPTTVIHYTVAGPGEHVTIEVFDVTGQRVRTLVDGSAPAGETSVEWDGRDRAGRPLASGVYFCRMRSGMTTQTLKMLLMK